MLKKAVTLILTFVFLYINANVILSEPKELKQPQSGVETTAVSAILLENSTGKILYEKDSHQRMSPASITKVMTMLLAMEAIEKGKLKLTDKITCSEHAASMGGSTICFGEGETLSVSDVLKGIAVSSGNDAAVSMAEKLGGSEKNFVRMMNEKAKELGMKDTHFENACGLDTDNHYSSAYDISVMSRELIKHSLIFKYLTIWSGKLYYPERKNSSQREFNLFNTNKLIRFYRGANGIKTGSTDKAKFCLSASALRDGMDLVAVVMGCENNKARFREASNLLNYGFDNYQLLKFQKKGTIFGNVKVKKGMKDKVEIVCAKDLTALCKKGEGANLKKKIKIEGSVNAPILKGQKLGEVVYELNGETIGQSDILASKDVKRKGFKECLYDSLTDLLKFK